MANFSAVYPVVGGSGGSGDVVGPGSSTNNDVVLFDGVTGKLIKDSGIQASALGDVDGPASAVTNNFASFNGTSGKIIKDSGVSAASFQAKFLSSAQSSGFTAASIFVYICDSAGGAFSCQLPAPADGIMFYIVDKLGTFGTNNVTLLQNSGEKIVNIAASYPLATNYSSWCVFSDGTDWYLI